MISVEQFKKDIATAKYPDAEEKIIKNDPDSAAEWCINLLKKEESISIKDGQIYICTDLQDVFEVYAKYMDWTSSDDDIKKTLALFAISSICLYELKGEHVDKIMALFACFDKWFGYDTVDSDGLICIKFDDLEKQYNLYRENVAGNSIPEFDTKILEIFGNNTERFLRLVTEKEEKEEKEYDSDPSRMWEINTLVLKYTIDIDDPVGSIKDIDISYKKLLYWAWIREENQEMKDEYYNGIFLTFIDLKNSGTLFQIVVNFEDHKKEDEEILLKDLIKKVAINLNFD